MSILSVGSRDGYTIEKPFEIKNDSMIIEKCTVCSSDMCLKQEPSRGSRSNTNKNMWSCPHGSTDWHRQAVQIIWNAHENPSRIIFDLLIKEANAIIETRIATRQVSHSWGIRLY